MDSLLAEETMEVPVYTLSLSGRTPFEKKFITSVSVRASQVEMRDVQLLSLKGALVAVYGYVDNSAEVRLINELTKEERKQWQEVVDEALKYE